MGLVSLRQRCRDAFWEGDSFAAMGICGTCPNPEGDPLVTLASRGLSAHLSPTFYRSIGRNPSELITAGIDAARKWCEYDGSVIPAAR